MKPQIIGCDPGANGAFARINPNKLTLKIWDMPMKQVSKSGKRNEVDVLAVLDMLPASQIEVISYIEDVWSLPHDGHVGAFNFGDRYGMVRGALLASDILLKRVRPQSWKTKMGCPADKAGSRALASQLFPNHVEQFKRGKDDGRAEAALIALYGVLNEGIRLTGPLIEWTDCTP
jgi:hypothetical protein